MSQSDQKHREVVVNGERTRIGAHTVGALLAELGLPATKIAVERNLAIVPKSTFDRAEIKDGDRIEIVQFVGGG